MINILCLGLDMLDATSNAYCLLLTAASTTYCYLLLLLIATYCWQVILAGDTGR